MFVRGAASRLALDSAQEHELRVLLQRLGQARQSLAEERSKARASVLNLLAAPQLDQQAALQLLKSQSRAVETEAPAVIEAFSDFYWRAISNDSNWSWRPPSIRSKGWSDWLGAA